MARRLSSAVLFCLLFTSLACAAPGAPPRYGLTIRAGLPLDEALQELAHQTGIQVVFFSQVTSGRSAPALSGEYTLGAALDRLLEGSDLTFRQVNERTIEVRRRPRVSAQSRGSERPATPASGESMEEVHVVATVEQLVATRVPTPLHDIPQSVFVISAEQIRQQNSVDLGDVLANAPGIAARRASSVEETAYSRGFEVASYHVDGGGALQPSATNLSLYRGMPDLSEFDHIEVLRGSDALFEGNSNPGGTVSLVRKRPLRTSAIETSATLGSWNQFRIELDATSPLTDDGALRGRTVAVYATRDFFFDRAHLDRKKIFGVLEYDFTPDSTLTVGGSYQWDNALPLAGALPLNGDGTDPRLPRSTGLTFDWSFYDTRASQAYLQYQYRFADDWILKLNGSAGRTTVDYAIGMFNPPLDKKTLRLSAPNAEIAIRPDRYTLGTLDATLTGERHWLGVREVIAMGGDLTRIRGRQRFGTYLSFGQPLENVLTFDPAAYPNPQGTRAPDAVADTRQVLEQYGAFASLQVDVLHEALSLTAGGRVSGDTLRADGRLTILGIDLPVLPNESRSSGVITPYAALLYRMNEHFSWYASYADVYRSQTGLPVTAAGDLIGPSHGVNIETGIKGVWRDGALNASLVAYRIQQRHVPVRVEVTSSLNCCFVSGSTRSRGVDLELDGELAPGWLIGSGYTYNANEAADGGIPSTSTPRHQLKIWTSKTLPGALSRWTVGGSLRAQTAGRGGLLFNCDLQSCVPTEAVGQKPYAVLDLRASFEIDRHWEVALSVNNVSDKHYYLSQDTPQLTVWYGEPRNVLLRFDAKF